MRLLMSDDRDHTIATATVTSKEAPYGVRINTGGHKLCGDEPVDRGGADSGPAPFGLLLSGLKGRQSEAIEQWKQNLAADPGYLASRLSLAELLTKTGDTAGAIEQYVAVVGSKPDYLAARSALAGLYMKANQADAAVTQLRAAAKLDAENASIWEQIGDAEKSLNHADQSREAYANALKLQIQKGDRKRIRAKMAF